MVGDSKKYAGAVVRDERFAHIATDPKFRTLKRSQQRIKADARWRGMVKDERFTLKASAVDKRGRPKHTSLKEDLLRIYDIEESSDDNESGDESDHSAEESESAEEEMAEKQKQKSCGKAGDLLPDIARGEGLVESSTDDDDDDDLDVLNKDADDGIEHAWGELDKDAEQTTTATARLAVCNMDWDRIRAVDLLVLVNSFKPERGVIQSVAIYPSEYGLQKMREDHVSGPVELKDLPVNDDSSADENCDDGKDYHREKLRQYQLSRLKFYYAVIVCDSPETANEIYAKCDSIEYECSATKLDLRFIPDDMTFDHEPKSIATSLPEGAVYEPSLFTNSALQCSSVTLTWDETPHERKEFMEKNFSQAEIEEHDLRDYIASDTDSGDDPYGDLIDDSEWRRTDPITPGDDSDGSDAENGADRIEKFKALVRGLQDEKEHRDEKDIQMEVTWELGLKEKTEKKIKEQDRQNKKLSPWEEFKAKKKKKKLEKKERKDAEKRGVRPVAADVSDDELPAGVDLSDPYFAEELTATASKGGKKRKREKRRKKEKLSPEEEADQKRQQAELALLVMDAEDGKKHFNLSDRKKKKVPTATLR